MVTDVEAHSMPAPRSVASAAVRASATAAGPAWRRLAARAAACAADTTS